MQDNDRRTIDGNWETVPTEVPETPLKAKDPKPKAKKAPYKKSKAGPRQPLVQLQLFHNIQFIYELVLAKLELDCLGVDYVMDEGMRSFKGKEVPDKERILRRSAYVAAVDGAETDYA